MDPDLLRAMSIQFTVPRQKSINGVEPGWQYRDHVGKEYRVTGVAPTTGRRKLWRIQADRFEGTF